MQGKAWLLGHPIHQMLIVFPLGLLGRLGGDPAPAGTPLPPA